MCSLLANRRGTIYPFQARDFVGAESHELPKVLVPNLAQLRLPLVRIRGVGPYVCVSRTMPLVDSQGLCAQCWAEFGTDNVVKPCSRPILGRDDCFGCSERKGHGDSALPVRWSQRCAQDMHSCSKKGNGLAR